MKKIVMFRFSPPIPMPQVSAALRQHIINPQTAIAMLCPGGVLSIFDSESTEEEITNDVKATGAAFFIFPYNRASMNLPHQLLEQLDSVLGTTEVPATPSRPVPLTVDQILDKINMTGHESLTPEEVAILEGRA